MWRERQHVSQLFRNLPHIQTLSRLNPFRCLDVYHGRTTNLLFSINVRFRSQHLLTTEQDQLRNHFSQAASIHFACYESSMVGEKHASPDNSGGDSTSIQAHISRLDTLLYDVLHLRSALLRRTHGELGPRFSFLP